MGHKGGSRRGVQPTVATSLSEAVNESPRQPVAGEGRGGEAPKLSEAANEPVASPHRASSSPLSPESSVAPPSAATQRPAHVSPRA